jgi:PKD repeat protein
VYFYDRSTPEPINWEWDLTGNEITDATGYPDVHYTYFSNGRYSITLTVTWPGGHQDTLTKYEYIHVTGCGG